MFDLNKIKFAYPNQSTSYQFTLRVEPGQIVAITGQSGSGKSTLLDLISGFLAPHSGTMCLNDEDLLPLPPQTRPVSILFQNDNLFDHLTVRDNLWLGLPAKINKSHQREILIEALNEVGLAEFYDRPTAQLSGGQQQRVALARTLIRQKPIVLLDEPFANLDINTADTMRELLKKLTNQHNWCTLIVSHLPDDANKLADRTYAMSQGQLHAN